jgi:hypothetical protein
VEKIKKMGASAVKMLVYYRPDLTKTAQKQQNTVKKITAKYAFPWYRKRGLEHHNLRDITENWYKNY